MVRRDDVYLARELKVRRGGKRRAHNIRHLFVRIVGLLCIAGSRRAHELAGPEAMIESREESGGRS